MKSFGQHLKYLRKSNGLSQEELALEINVSRSLIAKYENDLGTPSEEVLALICNYFKIDKTYFKANNKINIYEHYIIKRNMLMTLISLFILIIYIFGGSKYPDPVILDNDSFIKEIYNMAPVISIFSSIFIGYILLYIIYIFIIVLNRNLFIKWYLPILFQILFIVTNIYFFALAMYANYLFVGVIILIPQIIFSIFILISIIKFLIKIMNFKINISFKI